MKKRNALTKLMLRFTSVTDSFQHTSCWNASPAGHALLQADAALVATLVP